MKIKGYILVLFLCLARSLTQNLGSGKFGCTTLRPNLASLRNQSPSPEQSIPYEISLTSHTITAGQSVDVELSVKADNISREITGFILQMRLVGNDSLATRPHGIWTIEETHHLEIQHCESEDGRRDQPNTATKKDYVGVKGLGVTWKSPSDIVDTYTVQVVGAAIDGSLQEYWELNNAKWQVTVTPPADENTPVNSQETTVDNNGEDTNDNVGIDTDGIHVTSIDAEDEHDLIAETRMEKEWLERKAADIAQENLATETDALGSIEKDKLQHDEEYKWEMEDYEKRMYDDEMKRQARIEAELRDKEEWEAEQYALNQRREEEQRQREEERRKELQNTMDEIDINELFKDQKPDKKKTSGVELLKSSCITQLMLPIITYMIFYIF